MNATVNRSAELERAVRVAQRHRARRLLMKGLAYGLLLLLSAIILLPLGWMLTVALKPDNTPFFTIPPEWFPTRYWRWENFQRILLNPSQPFLRYTINTLIIVAGNIVGTLFSCSLVAYAFARLRFRGSEFLFNVLIITMLIPWQVLMIPQFLMFHTIGWYGTYLPLIVPSFTGNAFFIFLIRQYMRSFPRDLDDSARIDGCNYFQIFWYIILPLSLPVLAVCVVFVFQGAWNDLLGPLIYLDRNNQFTLAVGLANMVTRNNRDWNLLMAANLITIIPMVVVYFFAQEKLIGGIASVGLKG
ncbi:MAG TPA: carbohydrate ABC transporter permease [Roseiflexaceae bacterium]|nr:carbohydrate ABC transporter permease [Roseiflexaceae bacterium]